MSFHFLEPVFLFLLIPLAVLLIIWFGVTVAKLIKRPNRTYGSKYPFIGKEKFWLWSLLVGILMVLAMAKPSLNQGFFKASRGEIEVGVIIDRSISMRANDLKPTRLDIAKREVGNLKSFLREGDKVALFVFGKESHRKVYLSRRLENMIDQLARVSFPESLYEDALIWDSDFASMLENIYQSMDRQDAFNDGYSGPRFAGGFGEASKSYIPKKRSNRIVIIFSDGEDQFRKDKPTTPEEVKNRDDYLKRLNVALAEFRRRGLKIYPVGLGTQKGVSWTSLLRGYKEGKDYPWYLVKDKDWQKGVSRIDKENLIFLARSTEVQLDGNIWTIENNATTVKNYLSFAIDSNRKTLIEFGQSENDQDLWQYFLATAVSIMVFGILFQPVRGYFRRNRDV